eukprot:s306_g11.t1
MLLWILLAVVAGAVADTSELPPQPHDCVLLQDACGQFPANKRLRVVALANTVMYVADLEDVDAGFEACDRNMLTLIARATSESCPMPSVTQPAMVGLWMSVLFLTSLILLIYFCVTCRGEHGERHSALLLITYWSYDFGVGLYAYMSASMFFKPEKELLSAHVVVNMLVAMGFEALTYDWPLLAIKRFCPSVFGIAMVWLGTVWCALAILCAYHPPMVALLGHRIIIYGLVQWVLDILKGVVQRLVWKMSCGEEVPSTYALLHEELTHPVPDHEPDKV